MSAGPVPDRMQADPGRFSFSEALARVKAGARCARAAWARQGLFVFLVGGSTFTVNRQPLLGIYPEGTEVRYHGHIDQRGEDGTIMPWQPSQADLLAEDWTMLQAVEQVR